MAGDRPKPQTLGGVALADVDHHPSLKIYEPRGEEMRRVVLRGNEPGGLIHAELANFAHPARVVDKRLAVIARLQRIPLIVVDEVGYIPFDPAAPNLILQLVSTRYERASTIVTSNKPFLGWGEILGDEVVAAAMIDRLVRHAEILGLKGDSYRLRDADIANRPQPALVAES